MAGTSSSTLALLGCLAVLLAGCGGSSGLAPNAGPARAVPTTAPNCSGTFREQGSVAVVHVYAAGPVSVQVSVYDTAGHLLGVQSGRIIPAGQTGLTLRVPLRHSPAAHAYLVVRGLPGSSGPGDTVGCPLPFG